MKKFAAVVAALTLMTVGSIAMANAEVTVDGNKTMYEDERVCEAHCDFTTPDAQGIGAEISTTGVETTYNWEYGSADISCGKSGAAAKSDAAIVDGKVVADAKVEAETTVFEIGGSVGSKDVATVGASAGIGFGGHAEVGYNDGHVKVDVGLFAGVGGSVQLDINVGGAVDAVVEGAKTVAHAVSDGFDAVCSFFSSWF